MANCWPNDYVSLDARWLEKNKNRVVMCACGCGGRIKLNWLHRTRGIPKFILGHRKKGWALKVYPTYKRRCSHCGRVLYIRSKQRADNKHQFCSQAHSLAWKKTEEHKEFCRENLLKHKEKVWSPEVRASVGGKHRDRIRNGDYRHIMAFNTGCDVARAHKCRFPGCDNVVLSVWDFCREHMRGSHEESVMNRSYHHLRASFKGTPFWGNMWGIPLELRMAMYVLVKTKEELDGIAADFKGN